MSRLQKAVRPVMQPIVFGDWPTIQSQEALTLARWCAMTTMVIEFAHPETMSTDQESRNALRVRQSTLPHSWFIWVGRRDPHRWFSGFNHFGFTTQIELNEGCDPITRNYAGQSTAFTAGCLFVQTYSVTGLEMSGSEASRLAASFESSTGLRAIWPGDISHIPAPVRTIQDDQADAISRLFLPTGMRDQVRAAWQTV